MELTFASLEFFLFFVVCMSLLHASRKVSVRTWFLIIFSYLFYLTFGVGAVLVVTFTAVVDFVVGGRIANSISHVVRRGWLWVGLASNLGPLIIFKYSTFFLRIFAVLLHPLGIQFSPRSNPLVSIIGLSYFTFAGMSYVLDVYWEKIEPTGNMWQFVCYLVYFPKLIAGPIVRAADFLPQFSQGFRITTQDFEIGCAYLLVGAVKKLVIADQVASHVSMILAAPEHYNAITLVQGMVGYTVQIYADFSGYSDMAIGCARLMGIKFPQNFLMPYSSVNIAEFWRRWHLTMSSWFRDYVFLPLEFGSRDTQNANVRSFRNIVITMVLCGLWHGASWNFVVWGGLHGVALSVYQVYAKLLSSKVQRRTVSAFHPGTLASRALTLSVVMVGWIFFGTQTLAIAFSYLWRVLTWNRNGVALNSPYILPLAMLMLLCHMLVNKDRNLVEELSNYPTPLRIITYATLFLALACLIPSNGMPFVYVRF